MHETMKTELREKLATAKYIALTIDIWTDRRVHSFLGVTAHTFCSCQSFTGLLAFKVMKGQHTGTRIAEELLRVMEENEIKEKVFFVVCDNASNMRKAFDVIHKLMVSEDESTSGMQAEREAEVIDDPDVWEDLNEHDAVEVNQVLESHCAERLSCFAHTLQLVVKDGLSKSTSFRSLLGKTSKMANLCHQSTHFREAFEETFGVGRSIPATNATRWSSTFTQLSSIAGLPLEKFPDMLRGIGHPELILLKKEEESLRELVELLRPFAEATELLQGDSYATIGYVVPSVLAIYHQLQELMKKVKHHSVLLQHLNSSLCSRFGGLLSGLQIPLPHGSSGEGFGEAVYKMACVLDPSYAFQWLEHHHPGMYAICISLL